MPPGVQRYTRTKMVLPLRLWRDDENRQGPGPQLAHTVDISPIGGRLGGLRNPLEPGQTITLQRGQNRFQFRVIWTRQVGPGEIQAGIESVTLEKKIWGVDLPDQHTSPGSSASKDDLVVMTPPSGAHSERSQPHSVPSHVKQRANSRMPWIAVAAGLVVAASLVAFVRHRISKKPELPAAQIPLSVSVSKVVTPTVSSNPRPHGNIKVVFSDEEAGSNSNRLQVAEAPQGHVIYPEAPALALAGKVGMRVVIATDGRVKEIHVLSGNRSLAEAAVQAVRLWHYSHHELNGEAVEAETSVTIRFQGQDAVSISFPSSTSNNGLALNHPSQLMESGTP